MKQYLLLHSSHEIEKINIGTIVRVEAKSNYSKIFFTNNRSLVICKTLQWLQLQLPTQQFTRIHQTHLVNLHFITHFINGDKAFIFLENGEKINVSRRRKKEFLESYYSLAIA